MDKKFRYDSFIDQEMNISFIVVGDLYDKLYSETKKN